MAENGSADASHESSPATPECVLTSSHRHISGG